MTSTEVEALLRERDRQARQLNVLRSHILEREEATTRELVALRDEVARLQADNDRLAADAASSSIKLSLTASPPGSPGLAGTGASGGSASGQPASPVAPEGPALDLMYELVPFDRSHGGHLAGWFAAGMPAGPLAALHSTPLGRSLHRWMADALAKSDILTRQVETLLGESQRQMLAAEAARKDLVARHQALLHEQSLTQDNIQAAMEAREAERAIEIERLEGRLADMQLVLSKRNHDLSEKDDLISELQHRLDRLEADAAALAPAAGDPEPGPGPGVTPPPAVDMLSHSFLRRLYPDAAERGLQDRLLVLRDLVIEYLLLTGQDFFPRYGTAGGVLPLSPADPTAVSLDHLRLDHLSEEERLRRGRHRMRAIADQLDLSATERELLFLRAPPGGPAPAQCRTALALVAGMEHTCEAPEAGAGSSPPPGAGCVRCHFAAHPDLYAASCVDPQCPACYPAGDVGALRPAPRPAGPGTDAGTRPGPDRAPGVAADRPLGGRAPSGAGPSAADPGLAGAGAATGGRFGFLRRWLPWSSGPAAGDAAPREPSMAEQWVHFLLQEVEKTELQQAGTPAGPGPADGGTPPKPAIPPA
ncbi:hypothetical protein H696_01393 [Fonticula alba]|uniref:Uncharacterized protein n=1 Tax=Fonticula alba TaxID=691883 RepID=A0A058ZDG8_FONAL|nr:hypothetical protein H696_01393 [Fonticula alba]KCV71986.1 hypothetical protein H696_01393 [Fonticula alba]|eukprot:XP_009493564.1 hypothetical protein H696_01393 [Fonticula alba]